MSFASYSAFQTVVYNHLGGVGSTDVTTTSLDDIIQVGENYINRKLRVRLMEKALAVTLNSAGVATLPADYIEAQYLYLNRSPKLPLEKKPAEWLVRNYPNAATTGDPAFVAETNSTFIFGPPSNAAGSDVIAGTYYYKYTAMAGASTIHTLFSEYPELYLWAALANAEPYLGRDQRAVWQAKLDNGINDVNKEDKRKRLGGSPLSASPG